VITLNGHNVIDLAAPVSEHDVIAILPPIAGGNHRRSDFSKNG
jgi:molybdopterin converting factor small subunit